MKARPTEVKADGLKIYARLGNVNMPLSEDMIKEHCGHLPKTEARAWAMAERLKGKVLEFPDNISFGKPTKWDKRQERIERRKRKERGVVKVTIKFILEDGYDKKTVIREIGTKLLTLDGLKTNPIKDSSTTSAVLEFDRRIKQGEFYEKIYPKIIELLEEEVKEFTGVNFAD